MWQQKAADLAEAGVDVLPDVLQLLVLAVFNLQEQMVRFCAQICLNLLEKGIVEKCLEVSFLTQIKSMCLHAF